MRTVSLTGITDIRKMRTAGAMIGGIEALDQTGGTTAVIDVTIGVTRKTIGIKSESLGIIEQIGVKDRTKAEVTSPRAIEPKEQTGLSHQITIEDQREVSDLKIVDLTATVEHPHKSFEVNSHKFNAKNCRTLYRQRHHSLSRQWK